MKQYRTIRKHHWLAIIVVGLCLSFFSLQDANAVTGADWRAGRIMDDAVFFNKNALSVQQIQDFLNAKVPNCDTNGTQPTGRWNSATGRYYTRAEWGALNGNPPPYTCLKDYVENPTTKDNNYGRPGTTISGGVSAAQIIWDVAQTNSINPGVLIVLLQKEQSLITDDWPYRGQYDFATGAYCPDSGPGGTANCDATKKGFATQVRLAAELFNYYKNNLGQFSYGIGQNFILWNVAPTGCGGSTVTIENVATAMLYIYTPYQPNAAAIANLYGTGDGCSAYGNRNFWRLYSDWFGETRNDEFLWRYAQISGTPHMYLINNNRRYWIPSSEIISAWGLQSQTPESISTTYFTSLSDGGTLSRYATDQFGNKFFVDMGKKKFIPDSWQNHSALWTAGRSFIFAPGAVAALPNNGFVNRFIKTASNNTLYLYDVNNYLQVPTNQLYNWRYDPNDVSVVSDQFLASLNNNGVAGTFIRSANKTCAIDAGRCIEINRPGIFNGLDTPVNSIATDISLSFFPSLAPTDFVSDSSSGVYYLLDGSTKYPVNSFDVFRLYTTTLAPTAISTQLLTQYVTGSALHYLVSDGTNTFVVDRRTKCLLSSSDQRAAWIQTAREPVRLSTQRLATLPTCQSPLSYHARVEGSIHQYSVDAGRLYHIPSAEIQRAHEAISPASIISNHLFAILGGNTAPLSQIFNANNVRYVLDATTAHPIDGGAVDSWTKNMTIRTMSNTFANRFRVSSTPMRYVLEMRGASYLVSGGRLHRIAEQDVQNYTTAIASVSFAANTLPLSLSEGIVQDLVVNTSDSTTWLISGGKKYLLDKGFPQHVSYGYLSKTKLLVSLDASLLALIPTSANSTGILIKSSTTGVKLLDFGDSWGFNSISDMNSYISEDNPVIIVSESTFNSFPYRGPVSKLIRDDSGKIYLMQSGRRRWLSSQAAYAPYASEPVTYLKGTTIASIPIGTPL